MAQQSKVYIAQEPPQTSKPTENEIRKILKRMRLYPVDFISLQSTSPKSLVLLNLQGARYAQLGDINKYVPKGGSGKVVVAVLEADDDSYQNYMYDERPNLGSKIQESVYLFVRSDHKLERRFFGLLYTWKNTKSLCRVYDAFQEDNSNTWLSPLWKWEAALGIPSYTTFTLILLVYCLVLLTVLCQR